MVLYDIGQLGSDAMGIRLERHKRIKIFNEKGKGAANIKLDYSNQFGTEEISDIAGETINFNNGKIEYTPLDPKLVYNENVDKYKGEISLSLPNVKAGSVIEIAYVWRRNSPRALPGWDFQTDIPTRYSQFVIQLYRDVKFISMYHTTFHLTKDSAIFGGFGHAWAMSEIPSLKIEPFMRSPADYLQSMQFVLASLTTQEGKTIEVADSWETVGKSLAENKELDKSTFDQNINDKEGFVKWARRLSPDDKVHYLFNQVKTRMKWNGEKNWVSKDGIKKAWENKSGNWGEVNMALCQLLNQSGLKAYPMLVSTRDNGKMFSNFANVFQINKLVVYANTDSAHTYVLDASGKYNNYNEIPFDLLNSYGLCLNKEQGKYGLVLLENSSFVKKEVHINADIKPDGTMNGTAEINSFSYNKTEALGLYHALDEKKYLEQLSDNDNNLQILSLKQENADVDSLPLIQNINFKLDLPGTDDKYIYFNPNLFTGLHVNPFINERRFSDVDFGCNYLFSINGKYKVPTGYKIEALPKSQTIAMPGNSISFKRFLQEEDGYIIIYYVIKYKNSFFPKDIYYELHDYFKKMSDLLNEQIVLKKA